MALKSLREQLDERVGISEIPLADADEDTSKGYWDPEMALEFYNRQNKQYRKTRFGGMLSEPKFLLTDHFLRRTLHVDGDLSGRVVDYFSTTPLAARPIGPSLDIMAAKKNAKRLVDIKWGVVENIWAPAKLMMVDPGRIGLAETLDFVNKVGSTTTCGAVIHEQVDYNDLNYIVGFFVFGKEVQLVAGTTLRITTFGL